MVDVTLTAPGTERATSSSGSVTSTSICCAGIVPLSTFTRSRGNETIGNNSTANLRQAEQFARRQSDAENERAAMIFKPTDETHCPSGFFAGSAIRTCMPSLSW